MKKIVILGFILLMGMSVCAQGIEFFEGTFAEAQTKAKAEGKELFMDFYTSWCAPCKVMSKKYFVMESVGSIYNKKYVCIKVDGEKGEGIELVKKYEVKAYPTLIYAKADGTLIEKTEGLKTDTDLINLAKK